MTKLGTPLLRGLFGAFADLGLTEREGRDPVVDLWVALVDADGSEIGERQEVAFAVNSTRGRVVSIAQAQWLVDEDVTPVSYRLHADADRSEALVSELEFTWANVERNGEGLRAGEGLVCLPGDLGVLFA